MRRLFARLRTRNVSGVIVVGDHNVVLQNVSQYEAKPYIPEATEISADQSELAWLQWQARLVDPIVGRDKEIQQLLDWAQSKQSVRALLLTGEGGVGKSRLCAELAERLKRLGWDAGFVSLTSSAAYLPNPVGRLLIVDYPEENLEACRNFLGQLDQIQGRVRSRFLLLSRRDESFWRRPITPVARFFDHAPMLVASLGLDASMEVFKSACSRVPRADRDPVEVSPEALRSWLTGSEERLRPLFTIAAAIQSIRDPDRPVVELSAPAIVSALVQREQDRLRRESVARGLGEQGLERLVALAALRSPMDGDALRDFAEPRLELGIPDPASIVDTVQKATRWRRGSLQPVQPDIMAAALLAHVLAEREDVAPEWLWTAIEALPEDGLPRFGRLVYDAESILALRNPRMSELLASACRDSSARCARLAPHLARELPQGLLPVSIAVGHQLESFAEDDEDRANRLNNLSGNLADAGRNPEALEAIEEAVTIWRRLAQDNPARFEFGLTSSLTNWATILSDAGRNSKALEASEKAVTIWRRLAQDNPARFKPDFAMSINNQAGFLSDAGRNPEALEAIEEAVTIRRHLAQDNPARFEPDFAMSINNQAGFLSDAGRNPEALVAIEEAVTIRRRLAQDNPARFEPDFAMSLNNQANILFDAERNSEALEAIEEAVTIRRRFAQDNPARFEPDFAMSLSNWAIILSNAERNPEALEVIEEAVTIRRRLAQDNPARFEPDFAMSISNQTTILSAAGRNSEALEVIEEAVTIRRRLAQDNPARFEPDLAKSLNNRASFLSDAGRNPEALEAIEEAVTIRRRFAQDNPARFEPDLAKSLTNWATILSAAGRNSEALEAIEEAIECITPYAKRTPSRFGFWLEAMRRDRDRFRSWAPDLR